MPRDDAPAELHAKMHDLVDQIERDAFQRGWDAAIKHIMSAAASAPKGATAPSAAISRAGFSPPRKTGYGVVPALVNELLDESRDRGITPAEVVARGRERGDEIAESSVRQRLRKMKIAGETRNERGRWFRRRAPHVSAGEEDRGAATPLSDDPLDDGGSHAAA